MRISIKDGKNKRWLNRSISSKWNKDLNGISLKKIFSLIVEFVSRLKAVNIFSFHGVYFDCVAIFIINVKLFKSPPAVDQRWRKGVEENILKYNSLK